MPGFLPSRTDTVLPLSPVVGYSLKDQLLDYSDGIATDLHRVPGCRINYSIIGPQTKFQALSCQALTTFLAGLG